LLFYSKSIRGQKKVKMGVETAPLRKNVDGIPPFAFGHDLPYTRVLLKSAQFDSELLGSFQDLASAQPNDTVLGQPCDVFQRRTFGRTSDVGRSYFCGWSSHCRKTRVIWFNLSYGERRLFVDLSGKNAY